jgi:hypothetical protein
MAWWVSIQWWGDDRQVLQSGKPLCTRDSLGVVPKLARGLRPLEPRHVNSVSDGSIKIVQSKNRVKFLSVK